MTAQYENIPTSDSDRRALLVDKPAGWEWYLFASTMLERMNELEPQWRDYQLRFVHTVGPAVAKYDLADVIMDKIAVVTSLLYHFNGIFSIELQEMAFGKPGEPGDPELIVHLGTRVIDGYGALLRWSEEVRGLRVPQGAEPLRTLVSQTVAEPLLAYRDFVPEYARSVDQLPRLMATGDPVDLSMELKLTVPENYASEISAEMTRVMETI